MSSKKSPWTSILLLTQTNLRTRGVDRSPVLPSLGERFHFLGTDTSFIETRYYPDLGFPSFLIDSVFLLVQLFTWVLLLPLKDDKDNLISPIPFGEKYLDILRLLEWSSRKGLWVPRLTKSQSSSFNKSKTLLKFQV